MKPTSRIVYDEIKLPVVFHYYPHTIRVTSHSKDLALAGERIGYVAVSPHCEEIDDLISALVFANRTLGFVNAPALMQRLVAPLQRNSVNIKEYEERRDLFYNASDLIRLPGGQTPGSLLSLSQSPHRG